MKNLKEFKELIKKYESITLNEINNIVINNKHLSLGINKANILTNFGTHNCTLCVAIDTDCSLCVWGGLVDNDMGCCNRDNKHTYNVIYYAKSNEELVRAFKERAKYMRKVLKQKL